MSKMKSDTFDVDLFETRLESLKDTQEGIQQMSSWCLQQRAHHKKIVASWLNVLKRVRIEHRLCLFYLANDVIQYSKRKRYEFVESWATALQRATTMVRDERVKGKILRILNIWEQREVYSDEFISDLHGLLNINPPKKVQAPVDQSTDDDYQNTTLITNVRECVDLSNSTDLSFKKLPRTPNCDIENIKQQLKDKSHSEDVEKEIERYMAYIEAYNRNLQSEIRSRKAVLSSLDTAIKFYSNQRGEVKVVVGAYKNFGSRIKLVKKKLDEIIPNLPSPIPSPDINAPSPEPDTDLQLPDEQSTISMNMFKGPFNGFSSYLDGNLPFDINDFKRDDSKANTSSSSTASQPIEVIATRPDDTPNDSFNNPVEYYKPESITAYSSGSNVDIPGLSPMPVPPVQSEYTSLARSANQYGIIPAPHPPTFGNSSINRGYNPLMPTYNDNSYHNSIGSGISANRGGAGIPLMPPPMPPSAIGGPAGDGGQQNSGDEFNSTWEMNMSWTQLETSNVSSSASFNISETSISPAFDRKDQSAEDGTGIYGEHENNLGTTQDVDHRQLHLPTLPASIGTKIGLSKEKTRQLDIDHRNLISLTGSPSANDDISAKKSWLSGEDKDFRTNDLFSTGDVDYRSGIGLGQAIQTIDTIPIPQGSSVGIMKPPPLPPGFLGFGSMESPNKVLSKGDESVSPINNNNSTAATVENQKDDSGGNTSAGYDPADMVVDMDMSDEDLDDIFREVTEEQGSQEQLELSQTSTGTDASTAQQQQPAEDAEQEEEQQQPEVNANSTRPPLLETPPEYVPQNNIWDHPPSHPPGHQPGHPPGHPPAPMNPFQGGNMGMDNMDDMENMQEQQQHENWNQPMPYMGSGGSMFPPPPHPPFQMHPQHMQQQQDHQQPHFPPHPQQQQYPPQFMGGGGEHRGGHIGRGRGRGWAHSSPNPFRNAQRPPRGGGGSPYFNNRGRGGGMRGSFRGRFRGNNNSWM